MGFTFGKNWKSFIKLITPEKIEQAKESLTNFLGNIEGKRFLDLGCGSGLFSLAAYKLGATVVSIDIDEDCVECAKQIRAREQIDKYKWQVHKSDLFDMSIGHNKFDIVYSWGVLHHTGRMWDALRKVIEFIKPNGLLYIAIYNDFKGFPLSSKSWAKVKRFYNKTIWGNKKVMELIYIAFIVCGLLVKFKNPISYIKNYSKNNRGMSFSCDVRDWLGGYPYEYSSIKTITLFYTKKGFSLINLIPTKREGCNQYLFQKNKRC